MPSLPDETPDQDLAHVIQYAQLAAGVLEAARKPSDYGAVKTLRLFAAEERELRDYLHGIEERARAATRKLTMVNCLYPVLEQLATGTPGTASPPMEYLAGELKRRAGVSKVLRYYDCGQCAKPHWEDERGDFDAHVGYASKQGFRFGHRTELGLVR